MIIFYRKCVEDIILASVVKHHNNNAILREYSDNQDLLNIAKIYEDINFVRVKDFKKAIEQNYGIPSWLKNEKIITIIKNVLSHKDSNSTEVITHLAENLRYPERTLYGNTEKSVVFQRRNEIVNKEVVFQKRFATREYRNDILFIAIDSEHDIIEQVFEEFKDSTSEPFVILQKDDAILGNAELLGFFADNVKLNRFDAFQLRKPVIINVVNNKNNTPTTTITRLCEF
ncbi:Uncharacterised protein [Candidatus Tiddalikarchaeum anstoanum]|nr:Uncharacterised protein [Candidatus Tiddalikarchaeum anstoanum]